MNAEGLNFLGRVAEALERQVAQTDEAVARSDRWREENIRMRDEDRERSDRQREEELREVHDMNTACLKELREAVQKIDRLSTRLAAVEQAQSSDARPTESELGKADGSANERVSDV
jgi:hypothetical protein